jgi:hypothetical protein
MATSKIAHGETGMEFKGPYLFGMRERAPSMFRGVMQERQIGPASPAQEPRGAHALGPTAGKRTERCRWSPEGSPSATIAEERVLGQMFGAEAGIGARRPMSRSRVDRREVLAQAMDEIDNPLVLLTLDRHL